MLFRILFATAVLAVVAATAMAHEYTAGAISITHPWARASIGQAPNSAGFMVLENKGEQADALLAAEGDIAGRIELHTHIMDGGVMMMRPVEKIEVPAQGSVTLEPGGLHVMFIGLTRRLEDGERVPLVLVFEKAGRVPVELAIEKMGAAPAHGAGHMDGKQMDGKHMGAGHMDGKQMDGKHRMKKAE